jgi:hypothetical protein
LGGDKSGFAPVNYFKSASPLWRRFLWQGYRQWRHQYGDEWEVKFRLRFERDMVDKFDTHFMVGTFISIRKTGLSLACFISRNR